MLGTIVGPHHSETAHGAEAIKKLIVLKDFAKGEGFSGYVILPSGKEVLVVGLSAEAIETQGLRFGPYLKRTYDAFARRSRGAWK